MSYFQIILKFGLLYNIQNLRKLAEKWLKQALSGSVPDIDNNFIKILKIGMEIDKFCPEYDYIFEICSEEYETNPHKCVHLMENLENISKRFLTFLFRKHGTFKQSLNLLRKLRKSNGNVQIILETLDEFIGGHDSMISDFSAEIISLLGSFTQTELFAELTRRLLNVQTKLLNVQNKYLTVRHINTEAEEGTLKFKMN